MTSVLLQFLVGCGAGDYYDVAGRTETKRPEWAKLAHDQLISWGYIAELMSKNTHQITSIGGAYFTSNELHIQMDQRAYNINSLILEAMMSHSSVVNYQLTNNIRAC